MTCRLLRHLIITSLAFMSISSYAIDDYLVNIKQVSSSGKTIYVDSGFSNKIADEDYGVLVIKKETSLKEFIFKPVAKLRVVRVQSNHSIWVAYKVFMPQHMRKGKKLFLFSETAFLQGRKKNLATKRTKLVTSKGTTQEVQDFLLEGDGLAKRKKGYMVISRPHAKEFHHEKEIDLIDIDKWEEDVGTEKLYADGIYRSPYAKEFSNRKKVHTFEKMVVAFLNKYNDPTFDYDSFYLEQKRSEGASDDFQDKASYLNVMDRYEKTIHKKQAKTEKFLENLAAKGDAWSGDYSDEELSEVLNNISITRERQRRRKLLAFKYNYQVYASMGANLLNNENTNDPRTSEQNKYDIDIAWEGYFFKKLQSLKHFTMEASARRSQDGFYTGDANVKSIEFSAALHLNWYPYRLPNMIEANIPYIGILFRTGFSTLYSSPLGERGNYQVFGLPGIKGGIKYNFKNSYGIRLTAAFEKIRVERLVRNESGGTLPNRAHYLEGKIGIGISKFF